MDTGTPSKKQTFGQKAVGASFNPSGDDAVAKCKQTFADAIDQLKEFSDKSHSEEAMALAELAIRDIQKVQMLAVKALTWKD